MDWKKYWNRPTKKLGNDACKQVGRTWKKENYSEKQIEIIVNRICTILKASREKNLLELACGNGMITYRIGPFFKFIKAIDFSKPLINIAKSGFSRENIEYNVGDVLEIDHIETEYDCILVYFAFQYFNPRQADILFRQMRRILIPGGLVLLGEVADGDRKWSFYRGTKRKVLYYSNALRGKRIIGYWWKPSEILALCKKYDFELSIFYQKDELPNHYFRYDALLRKL